MPSDSEDKTASAPLLPQPPGSQHHTRTNNVCTIILFEVAGLCYVIPNTFAYILSANGSAKHFSELPWIPHGLRGVKTENLLTSSNPFQKACGMMMVGTSIFVVRAGMGAMPEKASRALHYETIPYCFHLPDKYILFEGVTTAFWKTAISGSSFFMLWGSLTGYGPTGFWCNIALTTLLSGGSFFGQLWNYLEKRGGKIKIESKCHRAFLAAFLGISKATQDGFMYANQLDELGQRLKLTSGRFLFNGTTSMSLSIVFHGPLLANFILRTSLSYARNFYGMFTPDEQLPDRTKQHAPDSSWTKASIRTAASYKWLVQAISIVTLFSLGMDDVGAAIGYTLLMLACTLPSLPIQLDLFRVVSPTRAATASHAADRDRDPAHDAERG